MADNFCFPGPSEAHDSARGGQLYRVPILNACETPDMSKWCPETIFKVVYLGNPGLGISGIFWTPVGPDPGGPQSDSGPPQADSGSPQGDSEPPQQGSKPCYGVAWPCYGVAWPCYSVAWPCQSVAWPCYRPPNPNLPKIGKINLPR